MLRYPYEKDKNLPENLIYREFDARAERFVSGSLNGYTPAAYRDIKVIHDPVWGTLKFYPWELRILDSPLLQRLRNINQLGLAVVTYPSAHHSRFEHTLGVTALITKMADSINNGFCPNADTFSEKIISQKDLNMLRLAALLHDVGHCFFSHLSETMYGNTQEFEALKSSFEIFSAAQPHEILGYVIINTPSFKRFFLNSVGYPDEILEENEDEFFDSIGRMIVGAPIDKLYFENGAYVRKHYLTEMINGQFDADSLDYLRRDSYITGLSLTYHIDRFLYKIRIADQVEETHGQTINHRHLTVPISGISTVEEIIFGKQMLTRYIYQHQKVLAADVLMYDIVGGLKFNKKLSHPCDFLYYCDDDIYKIYNEGGDQDFAVPISKMKISAESDRTISDAVKRLKIRRLPKKALVCNLSNIVSINGKTNLSSKETYAALKTAMSSGGFRNAVWTETVKICKEKGKDTLPDPLDIFYSVPKLTTAKNYTNVYVLTDEQEFKKLSDVARLDNWADEFSARAWNAYVFSSSALEEVGLAAKSVLKAKGIEID